MEVNHTHITSTWMLVLPNNTLFIVKFFVNSTFIILFFMILPKILRHVTNNFISTNLKLSNVHLNVIQFEEFPATDSLNLFH